VTGTGRGTGADAPAGAFEVVPLAARPELALPALELPAAGWPEFMRHDPAAERYQHRPASELAAFQVLLVDEKDKLAAVGVSIPFAWDGTMRGSRPAGTPSSSRASVTSTAGAGRPRCRPSRSRSRPPGTARA
jgi:hypothetical protein